MKKFASAFAALALVGSTFAVPAQAGVYTGTANVFKGIPLTCEVSVDLYSTPGKAILNIGPPEPLCALLSITTNPHDYVISGSTITIQGVRATTITVGNCYGDLSGTMATLPDGTKTITFDAVIPEEVGGGPCYVSGTVSKPAH
jgi:hypothetical protein